MAEIDHLEPRSAIPARRNRRWSALAGNPPGTCWLCLQPLEPHETGAGRSNDICNRPQCSRKRDVLYETLRRLRKADVCLYCPQPSMDGRTVCERHQYRKHPCRKCGGKVQMTEGRGRKRDYCDACKPHAPEGGGDGE